MEAVRGKGCVRKKRNNFAFSFVLRNERNEDSAISLGLIEFTDYRDADGEFNSTGAEIYIVSVR